MESLTSKHSSLVEVLRLNYVVLLRVSSSFRRSHEFIRGCCPHAHRCTPQNAKIFAQHVHAAVCLMLSCSGSACKVPGKAQHARHARLSHHMSASQNRRMSHHKRTVVCIRDLLNTALTHMNMACVWHAHGKRSTWNTTHGTWHRHMAHGMQMPHLLPSVSLPHCYNP